MGSSYAALWPLTGRKAWRHLPRFQADPPPDFGPTNGAQFIRDNAGPRSVTLPGTGTDITAGNLTQSNITAAGTGATIKIRAGTHRLTSKISFLQGQQVYLEDGAIIKGSAVVTGWTQGTGADADKWFATGQTQNFSGSSGDMGVCTTNPVAADELEDFYKDEVPLIAVTTKAEVSGTTDKKFMDRANDTVWIGFNPSGHTIERLAFWDDLISINANGLLKGGIIEHCRTGIGGAGTGVSDGVTLEDVEIRYCHSRCLSLGGNATNKIDGFTMRHCYLHHGGRYNYVIFHMTGTQLLEYNHFSYGNDLHTANRNPITGGTGPNDEGCSKMLFLPALTFRYNWSHDHDGDEWWDTGCGGIIEENVVEDNYRYALFIEANDVGGLTIRRNLFRNNGRTHPTWGVWGITSGGHPGLDQGQLYLSCSTVGEVDHNIFETLGITTTNLHGDIKLSWQINRPDLQNWSIHHNQFKRTVIGSNRGFVTSRSSSNDPLFAANNNSWNNNEYHITSGQGGATCFHVPSASNKTFAQWQAGPVAESDPLDFDPDSTITADL